VYNSKYLAVHTNEEQYVTLSDSEYYNCKQYFVCTAATPFMAIGPSSPCEILTLKYDSPYCELELYNGPVHNFLTYGNVTYYSVREQVEVKIVCEDTQASLNKIQVIYGTGKIQIAPGCTLKISQSAHIRPSYIVSRHNLESDTFFKFLKMPETLPHKYPTTTAPANVSQPPLRLNEVQSVQDAIGIVFNQDTTFSEIIRILVYLISIVSILGTIYCCYPRFRLWFNGCCFFQKPTKYWRDIKGYQVPEFISRHRQQKAVDTQIEIETVDEDVTPVTTQEPIYAKVNKSQTVTDPIYAKPTQVPKEDIFEPRPVEAQNVAPPYPFNRLNRLYSPLLLSQLKRNNL
jgi:Baculovirus F protein